MDNKTAKHFVLHLGSLITLYLSVSFLLVLVFSIINLLYPDAAQGYYEIENSGSSVRLGIAMLIVFFPTYIFLTRKVNNQRRIESENEYHGLTKWLVYLSLLVGGGVLLGDMVAIILAFLNGELTTRFVLKAGFLLVVVGIAFYYYIQDARGYWATREQASIIFGGIMTLIVVTSILVGFSHVETPAAVREIKLDNTQITDLQQIQWKIQDYLSISSSTLPSTLEEIYGEFPVPQAPEDRDSYSYAVTETGFELCATFSHDSTNIDNFSYPVSEFEKSQIKNPDNWSYKAGHYCFDRVIR